ncbi:MAG: sugar phosphate isomerase/epimerase [Chloroflexi bacterium]|nr:sugar phosphate isomerase/epimerase [Chloroflexota bacterium]
MRIICASICYRGYSRDEFASTLELAPGAGYKYMEIHGPMTGSPEAIEAFDVPGVRQRLEAAGLRCLGLYPSGWGGKDEADVRRRAQAIARAVRIAEELGADHIDTTGATRRSEGGLERVIDCVRQVLDLVPGSSPVKLTLEPHYGNVLQEPEDFARVLDAIPDPRVGICVDTGHFHSAHVDTPALIRHIAPRIYAVHLKDHVGITSVGVGRGEIDLPAVIAAFRDTGYTGDLTIELEVEDPENLPRYSQEAYVYVSGLLRTKL